MVGVEDVFYEIAQDLRSYSGADRHAAVAEFLSGSAFDIHLSITTDVEETELNYLRRYGKGQTFYFRLKDYFHGKDLVADIYYTLKGVRPNMCSYTGMLFEPGEQLYLFIHLRNVSPLPLKLKLEQRNGNISSVKPHRLFPG